LIGECLGSRRKDYGWKLAVLECNAQLGVVGIILGCEADFASGLKLLSATVKWLSSTYSLIGNAVLLVTLATEPHGAVLSISPDQTRSGGHMKAAGPMVSDVPIAPVVTAKMSMDRSEPILGCNDVARLLGITRTEAVKSLKCRLRGQDVSKEGRGGDGSTAANVE
jgi:hypothetical protein